jgi:hypothetical protein
VLKGSRLQLRSYLQQEKDEFDKNLLVLLNAAGANYSRLDWVSPIPSAGFAEYRDGEFLRQLGLNHLVGELGSFWPENGPCWDALARAHGATATDTKGVILLEAKSHRLEICGSGCGATVPASKRKIESALKATKGWLRVRPSAPWTSHLYQYANRLAHLYFLRCLAEPKVDAWLVNVYFTQDPYRPTSKEQWDDFLPEVKWALCLEQPQPHSVDLFLPAIA